MALDSKASLSAARGDGRPALLTGSSLQRTAAILGDADDAEPVAATRFKPDKAAQMGVMKNTVGAAWSRRLESMKST
jgi:hypothetical protein